MQEHQQRVIDEKAELDSKLEKLNTFINVSDTFNHLDSEDQELLEDQANCMAEYSAILRARIARFRD